jgi:hypothetical protein
MPNTSNIVWHGLGFVSHWIPAMPTTLLPWRVFFQVLQRQRSTIVQAWLRYWIFSDDGAAMIPRRGDSTAERLSLEERQKISTLFAATRRERPKTLH